MIRSGREDDVRRFIEQHWGDLIALHLLYLGIAIIILFHADEHIAHVGEGLVLTGMATLRFKGVLPEVTKP
jgi:hypothetical protein